MTASSPCRLPPEIVRPSLRVERATLGKADDADALLAKARAEAGTSTNACPNASPCSELRDTLASKDTLQGLYITGFVVGGVGAAAAIVGLVLRPPAKSTAATTQILPSLDPRRPGLALHARF